VCAILQDCRERRLVTGAGAEALERKDPYTYETPLIAQVQLGEYENAKRLLQAGADANAKTASGERALLIAAQEGREDLVQLLVDFKADLNARYDDGSTALHKMTKAGNVAGMQALMKAGADIKAQDPVSLQRETLTRPTADVRVHGRVGCTHAFVLKVT
jgi:ankyrin repeat protein